ncbi:SERTA domain-containing protein 1 [Apteryx rowi]|uniref:SERTA domain-containing protein 1 n=1 Tax=Apteryx rowi TaxID=308060 RepID=UPI000E1DA76A|nr:SERTA domain-containing protein 1 [Apteryx rowi]
MLAKGVKRKHGEMEAEEPAAPAAGAAPAPAAPSDSLFNISMLKLHQSLRHVEPNLRYLVLVANTLRRIQDQMPVEAEGPLPPGCPPAGPEPPAGPGAASAPDCRDGGNRLPAPEDELLLSSWDAPLSGALEGAEVLGGGSGTPGPAQPEDEVPAGLRDGAPEPGGRPDAARPPHPFFGSLELLGSSGSLLEDSLEGIFEDIDTSMYDCDVWSPTSLAGFKAFSGADEEGEDGGRLDMDDLDYLMDVLVGTHAL